MICGHLSIEYNTKTKDNMSCKLFLTFIWLSLRMEDSVLHNNTIPSEDQ